MAASFGRSKLRLEPSAVAHMLQACLGGIANDFHVSFLRDRSFRFSVCNRQVGFFINNLRSFKCDEFVVHFLLWGNGGPNFLREFRLWEIEEEKSWQTIGRQSYAQAVRQPLSGANQVPLGHQNTQQHVPRLSFLHRLSASQSGFLESAISAGHGLEHILQAFRFGDDDRPVDSFLDSLTSQQIQELRSFIASKPSMETVARTFYGQQSAPNLTHAAVSPVAATVSPSVTGLAVGAESPFQMEQPRTSVFERLEPAQAQQ
jgi:hypothetical protein